MIIGIGTDIVELKRVEAAVSKMGSFLSRHFTDSEIKRFADTGSYETIAGIFSAKEAVAKAIGTGFVGFKPIEVEIVREDSGKPRVILHKNAAEAAAERGISVIHVSISHCKEYATAMAVAEG